MSQSYWRESMLDRRRFLFSVAAVGGALMAAPAKEFTLLGQRRVQGVKPGDWGAFGYDLRSTRFNSDETLIGPENVGHLALKWTFEGMQDFSQSTPLVIDGTLYTAANDGCIYALDIASGELKWKFNAWEGVKANEPGQIQVEVNADPVGQMRGSAAYAEGRIFIGDGTSRMHCLDARTGEEVWRRQLDPLAGTHRSKISSTPIVYDGKIYVGTSTVGGRSHITCLDAITSAIRWRFDIVPDPKTIGGGAVWTAPALDPEEGVVYNVTGSVHGRLPGPMLFSESIIANDMESGELLWYHQLRAQDAFDLDFSCHPMIFEATHPERSAARRRCVGAGSKTGFHTFDRDTGEHLWTASVTNGGPTLNSTAYGHDKIYVVNNSAANHRLIAQSATVALHAWTGEVLWWTPNASSIQGATAGANGLFYQGFRDGTLQALDVETGEPLWNFQLPAPRRGGIVISNGVVYTACGAQSSGPHTVYAFSIDGR
ncbi:MAG: PQQ-binding-like beta-propeller repeat protein [Acidobacteriota bacterium]|nr:PQQ-binding-like beta-propeller repeat protein [Acidobacteriota bacterium]